MKKTFFALSIHLLHLFNAYTQLNNNGATIKLTAGSYLVLQNINFTNKGSFIQSAGTVKMTGDLNSIISGTVKPQFFSLLIAKNPINEVQLQSDLTVSGDISFISGLLNLNNRNILLLGTATIKGETETRRIVGATGGYVEASATLNAPASANPGNLGAFISSAKYLGNTIVRRGHQLQVVGGGNNNSLLRYFDIIPVINTDLNATLRFQYFDAELNGISENDAELFKKVNNISWATQGFTLRSAAANYVIKNGITDFFRWTISSPVVIPGRPLQPVTQITNPNSIITKTNGAKIFIENLYPTTGEMQNIYIKTGNMDIQKLQVTLFDMQGKLVMLRQLSYQSQRLDLPPLLSAGIYKIVIRSGERIYQQSFTKQ